MALRRDLKDASEPTEENMWEGIDALFSLKQEISKMQMNRRNAMQPLSGSN